MKQILFFDWQILSKKIELQKAFGKAKKRAIPLASWVLW
jgi:hypothetical protein